MYQARFVAAAQPGRVLPAASARAPRACLGRLRIHRRKHGIDAFTAIKDAFAGNPWIPPIPASA